MKCETMVGSLLEKMCITHTRAHEKCLEAEICRLQEGISRLQEGANIKMLQDQLPWGANDYSPEFQASPLYHKDFQHALIHILKALGKLSAFVEEADHTDGINFPYDEISKYLADVVICTVRMANTKPIAKVNLSRAVLDRIEEKMGVRLPAKSAE